MVYINDEEVDEMLRLRFKSYGDDELKDKIKALQNELERRKKEKEKEYYKFTAEVYKSIREAMKLHPEYDDIEFEVKVCCNDSVSFTWKEFKESLFRLSLDGIKAWNKEGETDEHFS